jgi:hypothetical protein
MEAEPKINKAAICLESGIRYNTKDGREGSINIALVTDDPEWADTDLHDYGSWLEFRKGVELTPEGRGIFDFYIRSRGDKSCQLCGNIIVHVVKGKLALITGSGKFVLWDAVGGFSS